MKKLIILSVSFFLSACANDWSSSGVPDMYEGQSQESVLKALQKNNWIIKKQHTDEKVNQQNNLLDFSVLIVVKVHLQFIKKKAYRLLKQHHARKLKNNFLINRDFYDKHPQP